MFWFFLKTKNYKLETKVASSKIKRNGIFVRKEGNANYTSLSSEPIQSRCAVLRYTKLTDSQILARLLKIVEKEDVPYTDDGLEAIIFTAQGDMRQVKEERLLNKGFCSKQKNSGIVALEDLSLEG